MSKHTPEPWLDDRATHDDPYQNIKILGDENRGICWLWIDDAPVDDWNAEQRANAARIIDCVNACAGMEDPAAEIAELKRQRDELLAVLHDAATSLETIQLRSFGADSFLDDKHSMRAYAGARAAVAREAITEAKGSSS